MARGKYKAKRERRLANQNTLIESLSLPGKTVNALQKANIKTVAELKALSNEEVLAISGIGAVSAEQIQKALAEFDAAK